LLRVLGTEVAKVFAGLHADHGVDLRTSAEVTSVEKAGQQAVVHLKDGATIEADLLVVGVGVAPNIALAEAAGLDLDNGVLVDENLRTSDPDIYAAGDIANQAHPVLGRRIRVEHWDTAIEQGKAAARNMAGEDTPYDRLPYFFTDQYDLGMEYAGYVEPGGYDEVVVRGDLETREFLAFWLADGRVKAGMNVNIWDVNKQIQHLVHSGARVDAAKLADPGTPLDQLV
jgi:3-phenylpropionate/trans-cinnamate dioxygenase ferredoxin reductase subunit